MASLYIQPHAHRFGTTLQDLLVGDRWESFAVGVAWVRRSGTRHLFQALGSFLDRGGTTRFAVGVDIENTSREGLQDLLSLDSRGHSETFIYHNEAATTFHPKLYLFSNAK